MADVTIKDEELTIDLEQITTAEYIDFASGKLLNKEDFDLVARLIGKPVEYVSGLSWPNYRRVVSAIFKKGAAPLDDPN
jgi:hypothetical protein